MKFAVTFERDEDGFIVASCPALPGCHSQGRTREEAIANVTEAIRGYIASMRKHGEQIPVTDIEEVEVQFSGSSPDNIRRRLRQSSAKDWICLGSH